MPKPITSFKKRLKFSDKLVERYRNEAVALSQKLIDEKIKLREWHIGMKALIRESHLMQLITAFGGNQDEIKEAKEHLIKQASSKRKFLKVFKEALRRLKRELRSQYKFLRGFAKAIKEAAKQEKSLLFILNRAKLYMNSSQISFYRGAIPVKLPQVPRDGGTQCKSNCKCNLTFEYEYDEDRNKIAVLVTWNLTPADHCDDCIALSKSWAPLRIETKASEELPIRQALALVALNRNHDVRVYYHLWRVA